MKSYLKILSLAAVLAASPLRAALVTLTDGSSLSGEIKEQANGDVVVATGAGEITVAKEKIRSIVKDSSASSGQASAAGVDNSYVEGVQARRAKYGNNDGIPRTQNLQKDQLAVTVGQLNYTGDAYTSLSSDLSGISYGLAYAHSYTDWVALEIWGDYSYVSKDFPVAGTTSTLKLQRYNVGIGPKVQKAFALGGPEQSISLIPSIGLTPAWSSVSAGVNGGTTTNSSSLGASLNVGLDFQFGGALVGAKYRYLVSTDVSGSSLKSSNTSAGIPELAVGFSF